MGQTQKLFRGEAGEIREALSVHEGITFQQNPFDFFVVLARYKFAVRQLNKTDSVLDAGCGLGYGSVFLSEFAGQVVGGDVDEELVERNQKAYQDINNLEFQKLDLLADKVRLNPFDAVISMDVIEHFDESKANRVAKNLAWLTKDSGFAVVGTPNIASQEFASQRRKESHPKEYGPDEFKGLLGKYFSRVFLFSMTDEMVSTSFPKMSWYLMALCVK